MLIAMSEHKGVAYAVTDTVVGASLVGALIVVIR